MAQDARARGFSTVWRAVQTTSSDNNPYLPFGSRALGAILYYVRIALSDRGSCADVLLRGAGEPDVHQRASVPKQESYHRHHLDGGLSRPPDAYVNSECQHARMQLLTGLRSWMQDSHQDVGGPGILGAYATATMMLNLYGYFVLLSKKSH